MKNKNLFIVVGVILVTICAITGVHYILASKMDSKAKQNEIEIPDFTLEIGGVYEGMFSSDDIINNDIPIYDFDAKMLTSYGMKTNHYVGIELKDVLDFMETDTYTHIYFSDGKKAYSTYTKDEISDDMYLVFYRDGKKIDDAVVSFLAVGVDYSFSVEDLHRIDFMNDNLMDLVDKAGEEVKPGNEDNGNTFGDTSSGETLGKDNREDSQE